MKQYGRVAACEKVDRIKHRIVWVERDLRELADTRVILTCYCGTLYDAEFDQRKVALLAELKHLQSALDGLESQAACAGFVTGSEGVVVAQDKPGACDVS